MAETEFDRGADILTDEIIDRHLDGGPDTAVSDDSPDPASDEISPDDLPEDTLDESPEDEDEDTEFDEDGEEDDPDEELEDDEDLDDDDLDDDEDEDDLDDDEDEEDEEDEEEDVLSGQVTKEDHERINSDETLSRIHKQMQRAFTKKSQELAEVRRTAETLRSRHERLDQTLGTPQGMADYLSSVIQKRPDVVGAAFEAVATGDGGHDFLVEVGLHDPDVFEKAYDRVHELQTDEDERGRHVRDRDLRAKESAIASREQKAFQDTFDKAVSTIHGQAEREAERLEIDPDGVEAITSRLKAKIKERVKADGSVDLSKAEVRSIAKEVQKERDKIYAKAKADLERGRAKKSQADVKRKAQKAKGRKRVPPRSKGTNPPKTKRFKPPEGVDGMDAFVDHRLEML